MTDTPRATISRFTVVLDTDDPPRLAAFYSQLLGQEIADADDDWITLSGDGTSALAFQLAPDLVPPTWPDDAIPQQFHLDLYVDDLDAGEAYVLSLGARRLRGPKDAADFRVFADPSGHPFCLCVGGQ